MSLASQSIWYFLRCRANSNRAWQSRRCREETLISCLSVLQTDGQSQSTGWSIMYTSPIPPLHPFYLKKNDRQHRKPSSAKKRKQVTVFLNYTRRSSQQQPEYRDYTTGLFFYLARHGNTMSKLLRHCPV